MILSPILTVVEDTLVVVPCTVKLPVTVTLPLRVGLVTIPIATWLSVTVVSISFAVPAKVKVSTPTWATSVPVPPAIDKPNEPDVKPEPSKSILVWSSAPFAVFVFETTTWDEPDTIPVASLLIFENAIAAFEATDAFTTAFEANSSAPTASSANIELTTFCAPIAETPEEFTVISPVISVNWPEPDITLSPLISKNVEVNCADEEITPSPLFFKNPKPSIWAEDETIPVPFVLAVAFTSVFPPLPKM